MSTPTLSMLLSLTPDEVSVECKRLGLSETSLKALIRAVELPVIDRPMVELADPELMYVRCGVDPDDCKETHALVEAALPQLSDAQRLHLRVVQFYVQLYSTAWSTLVANPDDIEDPDAETEITGLQLIQSGVFTPLLGPTVSGVGRYSELPASAEDFEMADRCTALWPLEASHALLSAYAVCWIQWSQGWDRQALRAILPLRDEASKLHPSAATILLGLCANVEALLARPTSL